MREDGTKSRRESGGDGGPGECLTSAPSLSDRVGVRVPSTKDAT